MATSATAFPLMFLLLWVLYGMFKGLSEYRKTEGQGQGLTLGRSLK
jgi:choline-glycine betaine transporter